MMDTAKHGPCAAATLYSLVNTGHRIISPEGEDLTIAIKDAGDRDELIELLFEQGDQA